MYGAQAKAATGKKEGWVVCECEHKYDVKQPPSPVAHHAPPPAYLPKAVDEDLYKISPDLLYANSKRVFMSLFRLHSLVLALLLLFKGQICKFIFTLLITCTCFVNVCMVSVLR